MFGKMASGWKLNFKNLISNPKWRILTAFEVRPACQVAVAMVMAYDLKQKVDTDVIKF